MGIQQTLTLVLSHEQIGLRMLRSHATEEAFTAAMMVQFGAEKSLPHAPPIRVLCFCCVFGFLILIWRRRHAVAVDFVLSSFFDLSLQLLCLCLFCVYLLFYTLQICVQESIAALWAQRNRALLQ